jgi:hypothetical protein
MGISVLQAELHAATNSAEEARNEGRRAEKQVLSLTRALEEAKQERAEVK